MWDITSARYTGKLAIATKTRTGTRKTIPAENARLAMAHAIGTMTRNRMIRRRMRVILLHSVGVDVGEKSAEDVCCNDMLVDARRNVILVDTRDSTRRGSDIAVDARRGNGTPTDACRGNVMDGRRVTPKPSVSGSCEVS